MSQHELYMRKAIALAKANQTPYGALIVNENDEFISAYNTAKQDGPTAHAEINVIQKMDELGHKKPGALTLYSTVEPCPMCMSAIIWAGIGTVVFGAGINDASEHHHQIKISSYEVAHKAWYDVSIIGDILREECKELF